MTFHFWIFLQSDSHHVVTCITWHHPIAMRVALPCQNNALSCQSNDLLHPVQCIPDPFLHEGGVMEQDYVICSCQTPPSRCKTDYMLDLDFCGHYKDNACYLVLQSKSNFWLSFSSRNIAPKLSNIVILAIKIDFSLKYFQVYYHIS